jgi:hypothetical protein
LETKQNLGIKENFSTLLTYALEHTDASYFMFCDQDDIWHDNKVSLSLEKILQLEDEYTDLPLLVHTDLEVTNGSLERISNSLWKYENINPNKNQLNRLLMHNTITGCTLLCNRALAHKSLPISSDAIMHDWWMGLVASTFGKIGYVSQSTIKYRQHNNNDTGAKEYNLLNILDKAYKLFKDDANGNQHILEKQAQANAFFTAYHNELSRSNLKMLEAFGSLDKQSFIEKRITLLKYKILKFGILRNIGLLLKV